MLVIEKYWKRGIKLRGKGVLNAEELGEWGALCMSAMLLMGIDGLQFVLKTRKEALAASVESGIRFLPTS